MAHELFGERFFGNQREPAWHKLGQVQKIDLTATEALTKIGAYEVGLEKLRTMSGLNVDDYRAIIRKPTQDDPKKVIFGVVKDTYTLITPQDAVEVYDKAVNRPVETIAALKGGRVLFISTKLPTIDIKGDEVENYLLFTSPMTGTLAATVRVTPVRVVCQNTLTLAGGMATETYKVVHDETAKARISEWLSGIYGRAEKQVVDLKGIFQTLAHKRMVKEAMEKVLEITYPLLPAPKFNAPDYVMVKRNQIRDAANTHALERRQATQELYEGRGTGANTPAAKGTAWGLYNAVVEYEDYRSGRRGGVESVAYNALFGNRAETKQRAFEAVIQL